MLREDRERSGLSVARASWLLGIKPAELLRLEAGEWMPTFDTYDRICKVFGWPQTFLAENYESRQT